MRQAGITTQRVWSGLHSNPDCSLDDVIVLPAVRSLVEHLRASHANNLLDLLDKAGLTDRLDTMEDFTLFAPSEQAISELPRAVLAELAEDQSGLEEILLHHVVREGSHSLAEMADNDQLETAGGSSVRVNRHRARAMVQCAKIIQPDLKVCGGRLHTIDRVLTPPRGDVLHTIQSLHPRQASSLWRERTVDCGDRSCYARSLTP